MQMMLREILSNPMEAAPGQGPIDVRWVRSGLVVAGALRSALASISRHSHERRVASALGQNQK
jgi:hypothetical protein